jgi:hypothetical protein
VLRYFRSRLFYDYVDDPYGKDSAKKHGSFFPWVLWGFIRNCKKDSYFLVFSNPVFALRIVRSEIDFHDCLVVNGCDRAGVLHLCSLAVCFH